MLRHRSRGGSGRRVFARVCRGVVVGMSLSRCVGRFPLAIVAVLVLLALPALATAQTRYTVIPVGDFGGTSSASGLNNANEVVGDYRLGRQQPIRAFVYRSGVNV